MSTSTTRTPKPHRETEAENSATVAQLNYDYESDKQLYLPSHWTSQNLEQFLALCPSPTAAAAACRHTPQPTRRRRTCRQMNPWRARTASTCVPVFRHCSSARRRRPLPPFFTFTRRSQHPWRRRPRLFSLFFSVRFPGEAFASVVTTTSPREICFDAYSLCIAQNTMKKGWKANPSTMTPFLNPSNYLVLSTGTRSWFWVLFGRSFFSKREILLMFDWSG